MFFESFFFLQRLLTWSEVRTSTGYSFLSQGHRPTSANKVHSKDDWLRQVERNKKKLELILSVSFSD